MQIISYTPYTSVLKLDIMQADRFRGQVSMPVTPGVEYDYEELKSWVRLKKPSLSNKEFDIIPCGKPKFRK